MTWRLKCLGKNSNRKILTFRALHLQLDGIKKFDFKIVTEKMRKQQNFAILYFTCWSYLIYAADGFNVEPVPIKIDPSWLDGSVDYPSIRQREKRSLGSIQQQHDLISNSESSVESVAGHQLIKRESEPLYDSPAYLAGYCGLNPALSILCLVKCNFDRVMLLKPYLGLIPELPLFMCQTVNTIFPSLPKQIRLNAFRLPNLRAYLKLLSVKPDDEAGFAKTSANALPVAMIRNVRSPIFDDLKPAIKKLEIHDTDKKIRKSPNLGNLLGSILSLTTDQFINQKCDKTNLDDEALRLISAMKTRKCSMDALMPGYFVFNAAPKVASTREISPLLKAWNMPLLMFTSVKCCMVQYATHKIRSKCVHKYDILNKPHGLPSSNGPDTVCNAIPTFSPIATLGVKSPASTGSDTAAPESEEITTVSPCEDDNKSELEECATESSEYSSEEVTVAPGEHTPEGNEDIESDENEY